MFPLPLSESLSKASSRSWKLRFILVRLQPGAVRHEFIGYRLIDFLKASFRANFGFGAKRLEAHRLAVLHRDAARTRQIEMTGVMIIIYQQRPGQPPRFT